MNNLLDKLHNDHKNFSKLLSYAELQLEQIKVFEVIDFETMLYALEYMRDYSDSVHHPLEDIIFKYFLDHYRLSHFEITQLMNEHEEMPQLTEKIINMLQCIINEAPINRHEFCASLSKYINFQKQHINHEESVIYPSIQKNMEEHDWLTLSMESNMDSDPLFDQPSTQNYQLLLEKLIATI